MVQDNPQPAPVRRFADAANRVTAQAMALTGWSADVAWATTPMELAALFRAILGPRADDAAIPADAAMLRHLKEQFPDE